MVWELAKKWEHNIKTCKDSFQEVFSKFANTAIDLETRFYNREKNWYLDNFDDFRLIIYICIFIKKLKNWAVCRFVWQNEIPSFPTFVLKCVFRIVSERTFAILYKFTV